MLGDIVSAELDVLTLSGAFFSNGDVAIAAKIRIVIAVASEGYGLPFAFS